MEKVIYLAGGCFWGVEKYLQEIKGVLSTQTGYCNGNTENPSYKEVCFNNTGHAEAVKVVYDDNKISLKFLLELFYKIIDPVSINKQGGDTGTQYRTGIYYTDNEQLSIINESIKSLQSEYNEKIAIQVIEIQNYYKAEDYHQKYLDKNPGGYCHIGADKFQIAKNATDSSI